MHFVSVDAGNSSIKVIVNGKEENYYQFPNVVADKKLNYITGEQGKGIGPDVLDITVINNFDKNKTGQRFLFGKKAEEFKGTAKNRANTEKSIDKQLHKSIFAAVAYSLVKSEMNEGKQPSKHMVFNIALSTGLPFEEWKNVYHQRTYRENLLGNHLVKFEHPAFKGLEVELVIEDVLVCVEGEMALDLIIRESGLQENYSKLDLIDNVNVLVDLGAFTGDVITKQFIIANPGKDDYNISEEDIELAAITRPHLTFGFERGIGHAMLDAIDDIHANETEIPRLIRRDIELAYTGLGRREGKLGNIKAPKTEKGYINIDKYFRPHAELLGERMAERFYGVFNDNNMKHLIRKIYISGGGSYIEPVVNKFKEVLGQNGYDTKNIITDRTLNPVFANAMGYYVALRDKYETEETSEESTFEQTQGA